METPPRKRLRSRSPSSSSSRNINKRFCFNTLVSPSVQFDPANHGQDIDTVMESDVPESPIAQRTQNTSLSVSFAPSTPSSGINNPFANLTLKSSLQQRTLATPVQSKSVIEGPKSVKKSARKTPGGAKTSKSMPFQIKVVFVFCR